MIIAPLTARRPYSSGLGEHNFVTTHLVASRNDRGRKMLYMHATWMSHRPLKDCYTSGLCAEHEKRRSR